MRVTSALWVSAFVRQRFIAGGFAAISRKGAEEAGAIFIVVDRLDGTSDLYAPAPQSAFDEARPSDRLFQRVLEKVGAADVKSAIDREARFDPDIWVIEAESRNGEIDLAQA